MADRYSAQAALFASIEKLAEEASKFGVPNGAPALRDLALAYRYAAGGAQPGSVTTVSK